VAAVSEIESKDVDTGKNQLTQRFRVAAGWPDSGDDASLGEFTNQRK
jgi:hypothetical protein